MINFVLSFLNEIVFLFLDMAPYILLGVLIAGVMHVFLSKNFVARHIGGENLSSVFKSALFGVPLPLCSCGVVPTAVYLKNSGASKSSVLSFLISTPQTGVDSITATWGMLGPLFAFFRALAALVTGMAGGIVNYLLDRKGKDKNPAGTVKKSDAGSPEEEHYPGIIAKVKEIFNYAFFELLDDIAVNFIIGLLIAALISILIPDDFFAGSFLSFPLVSMLLMVVIGIPMYICSTSSIPVAVAMIAKGISPGAAYVFLVAGPATNAASLAIISKALGKKTTIRYLITIITGSLIFGFLMDFIYTRLGISPFGGAEHHIHGEGTYSIWNIAVSLFFLIMLLTVLFKQVRARIQAKNNNMPQKTGGIEMTKIGIEGMSCSHCSANVKKALSLVEGVEKIDVNLEGKYAVIDGNFKQQEAEDAIRNAGYEVVNGKG